MFSMLLVSLPGTWVRRPRRPAPRGSNSQKDYNRRRGRWCCLLRHLRVSSTFAVTWCYFQYARCGRKDNIAYSTLMGAWSFEHLKIAFLQYMFEWHPPLRSWYYLQYTRRGSKDNTANNSVFYYNIPVNWVSFNWGIASSGDLRPGDPTSIVDNIVLSQ